MGISRRALAFACAACLSAAGSAQVTPKAEELVGTWERVSAQDLKTGAVSRSTGTEWLQFTRSHWTLLSMGAGRPVTSAAAFEKLPPDGQVKTNYARIWNERNEQIFAARAGTYTLVGDKLHQPATLAIYTDIIGVDRVLKITRLDKNTLVVQTEYPDSPDERNEITYRRID